MEDLYKILGVDSDASPVAVKKAYFRLAKKYHPDAGHTSDTLQFQTIKEAYEILSNPLERKEYDVQKKKSSTQESIVHDFIYHTRSDGTSVAPDAEIFKRREKELRRYRRGLLFRALFYVFFFTAAAALMGGGFAVLFKSLLERATGDIFSSLYIVGGFVAGFVLGLIWSLDRHFEIESFIHNFKIRTMYKHCRVFFFTLSLAFLGTLFFGWILAYFQIQNVAVSVTVLGLVLLAASTLSSDGQFWERLTERRFFALFMLVALNLLKGLIGAALGFLLAISLWLIFRQPEILWQFAFAGYAFTLLFASRAPEAIDKLNEVTERPMKTVLYLFALVAMAGLGIAIGRIL
ncbi:DnaJ domain-containing protein [Candidatus Peregrinibacteria bacterium]|nr:DnaJ domain-containing protein [Candidatus Peregrinibacteria bacterium]